MEGQGWDEMLADQRWDTACEVAAAVPSRPSTTAPPDDAVVINVNVPNRPLDEIKGWRRTEVAPLPPRTLASADAHAEGRPRGHLRRADGVGRSHRAP